MFIIYFKIQEDKYMKQSWQNVNCEIEAMHMWVFVILFFLYV